MTTRRLPRVPHAGSAVHATPAAAGPRGFDRGDVRGASSLWPKLLWYAAEEPRVQRRAAAGASESEDVLARPPRNW